MNYLESLLKIKVFDLDDAYEKLTNEENLKQ